MRNVERRRNIAVAVVVAGASYLVTFAKLRIGPERELLFGAAIASFLATVIGSSLAITYHSALTRLRRLQRGERLLAAWTIPDAVWETFTAQQDARADGTKSAIRVRAHRDTPGVPVVITEESLMVDDDFYHLGELRTLTWHETVPAYFDFHATTYTKSGPMHWYVRVPAAENEPVAMRKVWDYFQARLVPLAPASRVPRMRRIRAVGLALIPIGALAALIARWSLHDESKQTLMLVAMAIALTALPIGVLVSAMAHWWLTRGEGKTL